MKPNPASDFLLQQASALHQAGKIREAEPLYRQLLAIEPANFTAIRMLGLAQLQQGRLQLAIDLLHQALKITPLHSQTLFDLGRALSALDKTEEALACFEKIIVNDRDNAQAHNAKGIMLSNMGRKDEAISCFERAATLNPNYAAALSNLGNEHLAKALPQEALAYYDRALNLQPQLPGAWSGRGNALLTLDRGQDALESFDRALAQSPNDLDAMNGRSAALSCLKQHQAALDNYSKAICIYPNNAALYCNQGNVLGLLERHEEALASYEKALAIGPPHEEMLANHATTFIKLGEPRRALESCRQSLILNPRTVRAHIVMADALRDLGDFQAARQTLEQAVACQPDNHEILGGLLFNLNYIPDVSPAEVLQWHQRYGELVEKPLAALRAPHANIPNRDRPLRIGFVSGDLRTHPVGFFMEGALKELSKRACELYAYANQPRDDAISERIRPFFATWRDIWSKTDDAVAEQIRADGIDILVDLSGHTERNRLPVFARKPAPVQVTYLGYSSTTGLTAIDYILGNPWLMPEDHTWQFTETPWHLPDSQICYTPPGPDIPVQPPPALRNGHITFGNFNNLSKMNGATVACWANVLKAVPNSRLLLKAKPFGSADVTASVRDRFRKHGGDPDRLDLQETTASHAEHLAAYGQMDIALDPFPYNGTTTTMDALWMGVPVLALNGNRYIARVSASALHIMDMADWVAEDEADYVARAAALAADLPALAALRAGQRQRFTASPLYNAPRFAALLEDAFRAMWQTWCDQTGNPGERAPNGEPGKAPENRRIAGGFPQARRHGACG